MIVLMLAALVAAAPGPNDLHAAIQANDIARLRELLRAGVDPNVHHRLGGTALHDAAWSGYKEIAGCSSSTAPM